MHRSSFPLISILLAVACGDSPPPQSPSEIPSADLVITAATVIDGTGGPVLYDATIYVHDGKISALRSGGAPIPAGASVVDGHGKFVIPGLSDMHVHFGSGGIEPRTGATTDQVLRQFLFYGVTTIFNVGGNGGTADEILQLRARQEAGEIGGPRILATGGLITVPGSHPIHTTAAQSLPPGVDLDAIDWEPLGYTVVRSLEEARAAARERAQMDAVKIVVESGPPSFGDDHPQMSRETIGAITAEAMNTGLDVFAHVSSTDELGAAIDGGARGILHGVIEAPYPDEQTLLEMREDDVYYVLTLALYDGFHRFIDDPAAWDDPFLRSGVTDQTIESLAHPGFLAAHGPTATHMRRTLPDAVAAARVAHGAGVKIVLGTDTGNPFDFPGYSAHRELELLTQAGLSPMEAIIAGTRRGAEMLGHEGRFGTIEVGSAADLLILDADPLSDIRNTRRINAVIYAGEIFDRSAFRKNEPSRG